MSKILSKKRFLSQPHSIKQDVPLAQRMVEAVLLKERWKLVLLGVPRNDIRMKNGHLYVNGKSRGHVKNSKFIGAPSQLETDSLTRGASESISTDATPIVLSHNHSSNTYKPLVLADITTSHPNNAVHSNDQSTPPAPNHSPPSSPTPGQSASKDSPELSNLSSQDQ